MLSLRSFLAVLTAHLLLLCYAPGGLAQAPLHLAQTTAGSKPAADFLEDATGRLEVGDLTRPPLADAFRPVTAQNEINFGYSASVFWLRVKLAPESDAARHWLLEVGYPSLDRVDLFAPAGGGFVRQSAGDLAPFAGRPFVHRNFVFPLDLAPGAEHTLYLRVASAGSLTMPLALWTPAALHAHDQRLYAAFALYYGMLLALGLYNLLLYLSLRDRTYLAYVAFVASMAVGQASLNGFGNQFAWPDWPAWGNIALPSGFAATGMFGALFTRLFLDTRRNTPRFDKLILALAAGFAGAALAPLVLPYRPTAIVTSLLGIFFSATAVACGLTCLRRGHPGARLFLVAWTLLLVGVGVLGLRNLGWLPTNTLTIYAMQIGSALEMLLLSFALADRIHALRLGREQARAEALSAKQAMVDTLQRSERSLESRVRQRTLELAAANEKLRRSETILRDLAHHDPLTGLANRALLDDRLQQAILRGQRKAQGFALLLVDLDGFKPVNDAYGHAVGDELLKGLAARLAGAVRGIDTVARIGGDEFVVLLEEGGGDDLLARALGVGEKIVAALGQPLDIGPHVVTVGASVGIACWPGDGEEPQALLRAADRAMYAAKRAGRGRCRAASQPGAGSADVAESRAKPA